MSNLPPLSDAQTDEPNGKVVRGRAARVGSAKAPNRWQPLLVAGIQWDRWGFGVEFSLGHWWPMEFSAYLMIGPVLLGAGIEENMEWRYPV